MAIFRVPKNNKYGFVDKNGEEVIPCQYDLDFHFSEGMAAVLKDDKFGYIDQYE